MKAKVITLVLLGGCAGPSAGGDQVSEPFTPGQTVSTAITGVAHNSKLGAVIVTSDGRVIHFSGLETWPAGVDGREVRAEGRLVRAARLHRASQDAAGAWTQGVPSTSGPEWWLDDATWSAADRGLEPAPWTLQINDGSGNTTTISMEAGASTASWRYVPITPETSSSGTYSGGDPAAGTLAAVGVDELWRLVHALETVTTDQLAERTMGTTQVIADSATGKRSFVVGAEAAVELTALLRRVRGF